MLVLLICFLPVPAQGAACHLPGGNGSMRGGAGIQKTGLPPCRQVGDPSTRSLAPQFPNIGRTTSCALYSMAADKVCGCFGMFGGVGTSVSSVSKQVPSKVRGRSGCVTVRDFSVRSAAGLNNAAGKLRTGLYCTSIRVLVSRSAHARIGIVRMGF